MSPHATLNVCENTCPWYVERTRMYDEEVKLVGTHEQTIRELRAEVEGLDAALGRATVGWNDALHDCDQARRLVRDDWVMGTPIAEETDPKTLRRQLSERQSERASALTSWGWLEDGCLVDKENP